MRVLMAHNYYQQAGGEDVVFAAEAELLRRHGHTVLEYTEDNHRINAMNSVRLAAQTIWSSPSHARILKSLHNPRLLCPAGTFYRNGRVCEDCLGKAIPWPSILHGCYRDSRSQTAVVASMLTVHRWLETWVNHVDAYIVFTEFYRKKFIEGGLPGGKLFVKPHFVFPDPVKKTQTLGHHVTFIGRLQPGKGIRTLLRAWQLMPAVPLKIIGDGPLRNEVQCFIDDHGMKKDVALLGHLGRDAVMAEIKRSSLFVWPSEFETFGLVAIEAFACGVPVIASRAGPMLEIVEDGRTGLLFNPGDPEDLAGKIRWAVEHPDAITRMGENARREYELRYTAEKNYELLMGIYQKVLGSN